MAMEKGDFTRQIQILPVDDQLVGQRSGAICLSSICHHTHAVCFGPSHGNKLRMMAENSNQRFRRVLKNRDAITLAFGAMIGWSWVLMTGYWLETAGSLGTLIAFALGGLAIALIGLTYSELVSAMPKAGGEHVYTHRGLGSGWSFVCTWALLLAYVNVCLFEAIALPTAIEYLAPGIRIGTLWTVFDAEVDIGFFLIGSGSAALITVINVLGIKPAARFQAVALSMIVLAGIMLMVGAVSFGNLENARPFLATPATGVFSVLIMVPALLVGFDVIPQSAEEIDLPPGRIGLLLVISVFLAVAWYALISLAVASAMPSEQLAESAMAPETRLPLCGAVQPQARCWCLAGLPAFSRVGTHSSSAAVVCCLPSRNPARCPRCLPACTRSTARPMSASSPLAFCPASRRCSAGRSWCG